MAKSHIARAVDAANWKSTDPRVPDKAPDPAMAQAWALISIAESLHHIAHPPLPPEVLHVPDDVEPSDWQELYNEWVQNLGRTDG